MKPRIAIATAGRFHVLDLARELDSLGFEVRFYSYVPKKRALKFGLPSYCYVSLIPFTLPFIIWQRHFSKILPSVLEYLMWKSLNLGLIFRVQPCDIFICMSGIYLESIYFIKKKYGARVIIHRGSKHIHVQDYILSLVNGAVRPSALSIKREIKGYEVSDRIALPSRHSLESFEFDKDSYGKCFINPYGVDLKMFPMKNGKLKNERITFLFVGVWSYQKGCDLLVTAFERLSHMDLIHVGSVGDFPLPVDKPWFRHIKKVDQSELSSIYSFSDALILPSRQDGFGMVITQALASGLPVLCTDATGGSDVCYTDALKDRVHVIQSNSLIALIDGLGLMANRLSIGPFFKSLTDVDRQLLSWSAYAKRHIKIFDDFFN